MPNLPKATNDVIAILCSDLHLSHTAPPCRAGSPGGWYAEMARTLRQVNGLSVKYRSPVICAGDIFDHWRPCPELINFTIESLAGWYCIPGQHDLPNHNYDDMELSAYYTLVAARSIAMLLPRPSKGTVIHVKNRDGVERFIIIQAFPWGHKPYPLPNDGRIPPDNIIPVIHLAVVHQYVWSGKACYQNAPIEQNLSHFAASVKGYDAVLIGDNHKYWQRGKIYNNGTMMRRKSDEASYRPGCGLLHADGTITRHEFCLDREHFVLPTMAKQGEQNLADMTDLLDELKLLNEESPLDFAENVRQTIARGDVSPQAAKILCDALGI